jgi:hypothetical protein
MCALKFNSVIDTAHKYWKEILQPEDHAIDATCGNGQDTLALAQLLFPLSSVSTLIGIDIQTQAVERTRCLLASHLADTDMQRVFLYEQSHAAFPPKAYQMPIRLIVYNFGYLPRSDKSITTQEKSSIESFQAALSLIMPGGVISATCYPGHPEGGREQSALLNIARALKPNEWCVTFHTWPNRTLCPSLLLVHRFI